MADLTDSYIPVGRKVELVPSQNNQPCFELLPKVAKSGLPQSQWILKEVGPQGIIITRANKQANGIRIVLTITNRTQRREVCTSSGLAPVYQARLASGTVSERSLCTNGGRREVS